MANGKRKKSQGPKSKSDKPDWIMDVLGKWADAADKNDCDPLGLNDAPAWVLKAWIECCKIVFPGGLPAPEKWDAKFLGELLGRLYGLENLYAGEIPLGPETQAEKEKIEAAANKLPPQINAKALEKDFLTKFAATREAIPQATVAASAASYQDAMSFQKGLARGIEIKPDELASSRTMERHTRTYFVLAKCWRAVMNCRSLKHVHELLCAGAGETRIGNFKTFEKACQKIGLSLRKPGRPRKQK